MTTPAPLGVKPRFLVAEERFDVLAAAISRYTSSGRAPLPEWYEEAAELATYLAHYHKEK